jgi:hypothetical protein
MVPTVVLGAEGVDCHHVQQRFVRTLAAAIVERLDAQYTRLDRVQKVDRRAPRRGTQPASIRVPFAADWARLVAFIANF